MDDQNKNGSVSSSSKGCKNEPKLSSEGSQEEQEFDCRVELPLAIKRDIQRQQKLEKLKQRQSIKGQSESVTRNSKPEDGSIQTDSNKYGEIPPCNHPES